MWKLICDGPQININASAKCPTHSGGGGATKSSRELIGVEEWEDHQIIDGELIPLVTGTPKDEMGGGGGSIYCWYAALLGEAPGAAL